MTQARRLAWLRGRAAARPAAWFLRRKGFSILEVDYRTPVGEIDLIAQRRDLLALVEVKARPTLDQARHAITARQRQRIIRAAEVYLQRNPRLGKLDTRFDVVLIAPGRWPRHIVDAWRAVGMDR
ncbi:MAG: YraN family protein [Pseudomonadota bacterium]